MQCNTMQCNAMLFLQRIDQFQDSTFESPNSECIKNKYILERLP